MGGVPKSIFNTTLRFRLSFPYTVMHLFHNSINFRIFLRFMLMTMAIALSVWSCNAAVLWKCWCIFSFPFNWPDIIFQSSLNLVCRVAVNKGVFVFPYSFVGDLLLRYLRHIVDFPICIEYCGYVAFLRSILLTFYVVPFIYGSMTLLWFLHFLLPLFNVFR